MLTLRDYQEEAVAHIIESLRAGANPVCNLPTGSGKSVVLAELCNRLDGRILVVTHRKELIQQNEATLHRNGGDSVGAYSAGLGRRDMNSRIIVAGVASIYRRMDELQAAGPFRYILYDESHFGLSDQSGNTMGDQVLRACPSAQRVGLSATPYRMPDTPIWGYDVAWFDEVAVEKGILELTNAGYLCRLVGVQTASAPKLDHVRTRGGDYAIGDLSQASSEQDVVDSACDEILYLARDRRSILIFCVDVQHAGIVAEALSERGCNPEVVTGTTPSEERADILTRFKNSEVRHLINVGVLTTGMDSPVTDCVVLMRASMSRSLIIQMIGRGSRLHPEKMNCIAEGQLVLTDRGLIPIERVPLDCKVWDGVEWVSHDGPIYKGIQEVITYAGLTATREHLVYTAEGWQEFEDCASRETGILQTGRGRCHIENSDCYISYSRMGREEEVYCLPVYDLWGERSKILEQSDVRRSWLPSVFKTSKSPKMVIQEIECCKTKMRESESPCIPELWGEGYSVQICICNRCGDMGTRESRNKGGNADRQNRQRWSLRTREYKMVYSALQSIAYSAEQHKSSVSCFSDAIPSCGICGFNDKEFSISGAYIRADRRKMVFPIRKAMASVWDLLNAGPRNRFTVSGLLVHNCLVLDLGGNLERHAPIDGLPKVLRSPKLAEVQEKQQKEAKERDERDRKVRHSRFAAIGIDPLAPLPEHQEGVLLAVTGCSFALRPAKKHPDRQNLLVSYKCETATGVTRTVTQFVLIQYPGRPGLEADAWFSRRNMFRPWDARQALRMAWRAPVPEAIVVQKDGGWDRVLMEQFGEV